MILPYSTDAPIYHWPFATVGLIVLNTALLFVSPAATEAGYALDLGQGLHPIQWVTHNFLHLGPGHLVGNMIFLWAFGIVVEGKIGPFWYLVIYLLIGICHGISVQIACLHVEPSKLLGASSIIYGLLAVCMIWAPKNELQCLVFFAFGFRGYGDIWDIPIMTFAIFYIGWELAWLGFLGMTGFSFVSSAMAHISGAVWGTLIGILMVKMKWVDCENWDIFAVIGGHQGKSKAEIRPSSSRPVIFDKEKEKAHKSKGGNWEKTPETRAAESIRKIRKQIEARDPDAVRDAYVNARSNEMFEPAEDILRDWIKELHVLEAWKPSLPLMRDYIRRFPDKSVRVRLRLVQILIKQQRPAQAMRELQQLRQSALPPQLAVAHGDLEAKAHQMLEEGVLELEGDD
jgi:membrane associated rhomboid family serine protease